MALRSLNPGDRSNRTRYRPMAEINVTPFVDVMLILLVVFMVSAPLLTIGVPLDLPEGDAPALNLPEIKGRVRDVRVLTDGSIVAVTDEGDVFHVSR